MAIVGLIYETVLSDVQFGLLVVKETFVHNSAISFSVLKYLKRFKFCRLCFHLSPTDKA